MLAVSATYTPALLAQLEALMTQPQRVLLSPDTTSLLGVRQFYSLVPGAPSRHECRLWLRPAEPPLNPVCEQVLSGLYARLGVETSFA